MARVARLHALFVLAWALLRTLLARMTGNGTGVAAFRANYDGDRLPPATPDEREVLATMAGCIACGLCDVGGLHPRGAGPMDLALAASRTASDADAASVAMVPDSILAERERICPAHVPLLSIARLTRERASEVSRTSLPPPPPTP